LTLFNRWHGRLLDWRAVIPTRRFRVRSDAAIAGAREASAQHGQTARNIAQIAETLSNRVNDLTTHVDSLDERLKA
jgi:hypothetical protein